MDNFDVLIDAIEKEENFRYDSPFYCIGGVLQRLEPKKNGGSAHIADFLGITVKDASDLFWNYNSDNDGDWTKKKAIENIRKLQKKYKEVK